MQLPGSISNSPGVAMGAPQTGDQQELGKAAAFGVNCLDGFVREFYESAK